MSAGLPVVKLTGHPERAGKVDDVDDCKLNPITHAISGLQTIAELGGHSGIRTFIGAKAEEDDEAKRTRGDALKPPSSPQLSVPSTPPVVRTSEGGSSMVRSPSKQAIAVARSGDLAQFISLQYDQGSIGVEVMEPQDWQRPVDHFFTS